MEYFIEYLNVNTNNISTKCFQEFMNSSMLNTVCNNGTFLSEDIITPLYMFACMIIFENSLYEFQNTICYVNEDYDNRKHLLNDFITYTIQNKSEIDQNRKHLLKYITIYTIQQNISEIVDQKSIFTQKYIIIICSIFGCITIVFLVIIKCLKKLKNGITNNLSFITS